MGRRVYSIADELLSQSRDAALTAIQVFNNPQVSFKSETFIVMINIAWTYLLHAYYHKNKVEHRYYRKTPKSRRFIRTKSAGYKYWDLSKCLSSEECPLDRPTKANLEFLVGLRDEITHHMSPDLDRYVSAKFQAACLNYNRCIKELFGDSYGIDHYMTYSLQLQAITRDQLAAPAEADLSDNVRSYIAEFESELTADELNSERFGYRMFFVPKLVGKAGQADEVVEFIAEDSELAEQLNEAYVVVKEREREKFLPGSIVTLMQQSGFPKFNMHDHTMLWQSLDGKNPGHGHGTDVEGRWYWYQSWVDLVQRHCEDNAAIYS